MKETRDDIAKISQFQAEVLQKSIEAATHTVQHKLDGYLRNLGNMRESIVDEVCEQLV